MNINSKTDLINIINLFTESFQRENSDESNQFILQSDFAASCTGWLINFG